MMRKTALMLAAVAALAACGQRTDTQPATNLAENRVAGAQHPSFCFFKDEETKGWAAKRAANGDVAVSGKAHVKDSRYVATLDSPEVSGTTAKLWLSINPNSGAYGAADDWWDVSSTISGSAAVSDVTVMCGPKPIAQLKLPAEAAR